MRSRWFHKPSLHPPAPGVEKKAGWLELFYDLIFVAAFIQLGNGLAEALKPDSGADKAEALLIFAGVFVPLWVVWTGFTYVMNRFTVDDFVHRLLVFGQMMAVGALALNAPRAFTHDSMGFSLSGAVALGLVSVFYMRTWAQVPMARAYSRYWGGVFAVGALCWVVAAFVPSASLVLWLGGVAAILAAPLSRHSRELAEQMPSDDEHLSERYGLLTIIVLGESFVKVLTELAGATTGDLYPKAALLLVVTCGLWWIYFDDVAGSKLKRVRFGPTVWLYAHLPLQLSITGVGVAIKKALAIDLESMAPSKEAWLLCGALSMTLASVAMIDSVTERRQADLSDRTRVGVRIGSAALMLLLAPVATQMSGWVFLGLVMALIVAQVVFDMMMAPLEAGDPHHHGGQNLADHARQHMAGKLDAPPPVRDVREAVRKGAPSELRRDFYVFFLEGSWGGLMVAMGFLYVMLNVFFAALYTLDPECLSGGSAASFGSAFFFSVQTMSTIGYGAMSPANTYGDLIVTIEAAVGLLGVALATGVMFAKVARPSSGALFARSMVLHERDGKPVLAFRVGNARGTEIVDASMTVSVIKDEITAEGHHLRRIHDLQLVRPRSPIFTLSWLVMHIIDEDSPLANIDWSAPQRDIISIICTMTGHDATYAQTVHTRHLYTPDAIEVGARYVDVISALEDGRMMVDYDLFHDTIPEEDGLTEHLERMAAYTGDSRSIETIRQAHLDARRSEPAPDDSPGGGEEQGKETP